MAITRTPMVDDDGSGTTGTIINAAWKVELYDQIDAAVTASSAVTEGIWAPTDASGAGLTFGGLTGGYVTIGPIVIATTAIVWPATSNTATCVLTLPLPAVAVGSAPGWNYPAGLVAYTNVGTPITAMIAGGLYLFTFGGVAMRNVDMSSKEIRLEVIYRWQ